MSVVSSHPPQERSQRQWSGREIATMALGIVALLAFVLLVLPTDLLLFDLVGVPVLGAIAQILYPLALGPEILFSPITLLPAVAAIVGGGRRPWTTAGAHSSSAALARAGMVLGWVVVALDAVSVGLVILSFQGILKPLI